jgi:hypothetical protein
MWARCYVYPVIRARRCERSGKLTCLLRLHRLPATMGAAEGAWAHAVSSIDAEAPGQTEAVLLTTQIDRGRLAHCPAEVGTVIAVRI